MTKIWKEVIKTSRNNIGSESKQNSENILDGDKSRLSKNKWLKVKIWKCEWMCTTTKIQNNIKQAS